jgi:hypothetical protein
MKKLIGTFTILLFVGALPLLAQEAGAAGGAGQPGAAVNQTGVDNTAPPQGAGNDQQANDRSQVQQENAARTGPPSVRGAETTPTPTQQPGQVAGGAPTGADQSTTGANGQDTYNQNPQNQANVNDRSQVTQRAGVETERTAGGENAGGGAMPTTATQLPALIIVGAVLVALGAGMRLAVRRR